MDIFSDSVTQTRVLQSLIPLLMAILFAQSGLDKIVDFQGNLEWMTGHFSKTFFRSVVKPSLVAITVMELLAAALCAAGAIMILFTGETTLAFLGLAVSGATLLALFTGQRVAKEYPGAATLAMYTGLAVLGLFVLR